MLKQIITLFKIYGIFILFFLIQKPLFMLYYHDIYQTCSLSDYFQVMWHGLKLDISMAGYFVLLPGILLIALIWVKASIMKPIFNIYFGLMAELIAIVFIADLGLYRFWGFRLDSSPLFYLQSPKNALASVSFSVIIFGFLGIQLVAALMFYTLKRLVVNKLERDQKLPRKILVGVGMLLVTASLILPIRGGYTVSTMTVGKVYYSRDTKLNHAAINPFFNFMESLTLEQSFDKQYRFLTAEQAEKEFKTLVDKPVSDSVPSLFTVKRPNIIVVVLESFMSLDVEPLGGKPNIAVRINGFCKEGVLFRNMYANSFRTDRGLVSIFSGYPAQPTTSIMKFNRKCQNLPSLPMSLKKANYDLQYYYGGDADFTNMSSYLLSMGIEKVVSDVDFPLKDRMTKWGAPDHIVFNRFATDLANTPQKEPFMKVFQTLSSHEPFDVPFHKHADLYLNSVSYTDSCLGAFIDKFRTTKYWKNTVVVLVPDHAMHYPAEIDNRSVNRYKIPLLLIGGAIKTPREIDTYASQIDIAATLLAQLQLPHSEFKFSKNILNPASPHFGYFTFPNGFGMVTPENEYVFDCNSNTASTNTGKKNLNKTKAEAMIQSLYDDFSKR